MLSTDYSDLESQESLRSLCKNKMVWAALASGLLQLALSHFREVYVWTYVCICMDTQPSYSSIQLLLGHTAHHWPVCPTKMGLREGTT